MSFTGNLKQRSFKKDNVGQQKTHVVYSLLQITRRFFKEADRSLPFADDIFRINWWGGINDACTPLEACWISDYSVSYASDAALVQETVTINVSDIMSASGVLPADLDDVEPYSILGTGVAMSDRFVGAEG